MVTLFSRLEAARAIRRTYDGQRGCSAYTQSELSKKQDQKLQTLPTIVDKDTIFYPDLITMDGVGLGDLIAGRRVVGLEDREDVDIFIQYIVRSMRLKAASRSNFPYRLSSETAFVDYTDKLFKNKFYGRVDDIDITILPPSLAGLKDPHMIDPEIVFTFLTGMYLYSTGRGRLPGRLFISSTVYYKNTPMFPGINAAINRVVTPEDQNALENLLSSSQLSWEEAQRLSLMHQVRAGLPGLGKRR